MVMRNLYTYFTFWMLSLVLLGTVGCNKDKVEAITFGVSSDALSYKLGDSITFKFAGYADYITYYSGEKVAVPTASLLGNRYEFRNRALANGKAILQFQSLLQNAGQANSLSLLVSRNFNGKYDSANIVAATWVDITDRLILSDGSSTSVFTPSGSVDVSDFKDSAVFFAFRYKAVTGQPQPRWILNNFNLTFYAKGVDTSNNVTNDTLAIATLNPVWRAVNILNNSNRWSVTTTQLAFVASSTPTTPDNEDWVISRDLYLNRVPTDKPTAVVKTYTDPMMAIYKPPPYTKPGKYKVSFMASNANATAQKTVVKELQIEISP